MIVGIQSAGSYGCMQVVDILIPTYLLQHTIAWSVVKNYYSFSPFPLSPCIVYGTDYSTVLLSEMYNLVKCQIFVFNFSFLFSFHTYIYVRYSTAHMYRIIFMYAGCETACQLLSLCSYVCMSVSWESPFAIPIPKTLLI